MGVIAGILFLGIELRQNNALLEAEARADRRDIARKAVLRRLNYPELRQETRKFYNGETLTQDELDVLDASNQAVLTDWQYIYFELRQGILEEDAVILFRVAGSVLYAQPEHGVLLGSRQGGADLPSMVRGVDGIRGDRGLAIARTWSNIPRWYCLSTRENGS